MSYGSTFAPFEANGRLSSRPSHVKKDFHDTSGSKLVRYEKEFDVNLSRIERPDKTSIKESMVAYSKKMKTLQDSRFTSKEGQGDPLFVRAKHIPKYPARPPKKRRPMSFDELLGRDRESNELRPHGAKPRPKSDKSKPVRDEDKKNGSEVRLPMLTERLKKPSSNMHVSLVSASDLYDIVDFSLKSKGSRNDSLRLLRLEKELGSGHIGSFKSPNHSHAVTTEVSKPIVPSHDDYSKYERTHEPSSHSNSDRVSSSKSPEDFTIPEFPDLVPSDTFYQRTFALGPLSPRSTSNLIAKEAQENETRRNALRLPALTSGPFQKRPKRAKRMKLYDPGLGDIPEDNVYDTKDNSSGFIIESPRVTSPPPKPSPRSLDIASGRSLDAIHEHSERTSLIETVSQINGVIDRRFGAADPASDRRFGAVDSASGRLNETYEHNSRGVSVHVKRNGLSPAEESKVTKKILIRDDGDVRIEVTQCPPKYDTLNTKQKAQRRFAKKLIYLRDTPR